MKNIKPQSLDVELTWACNESCIHCYLVHSKPPLMMDDKTISNLVSEIKKSNISKVLLTGGEVFLHPKLFDILDDINSPDLNLKIFSNLNICSKDDLDRLKNYNIRVIQTSIYSMNPEVHDKITGVKGSFAKTLSAIKYLNKIGINIEVACSLTTVNYKDLFEIIQYFGKLNIKSYANFFIDGETGLKNDNLNYRLNETHLRELFDINYKEYPEFLYLWGKQTSMHNMSLSDLHFFDSRSLSIKPDGSVTPMIGVDINLGNINDELLFDIANSDRALELNKITMADFEECKECDAVSHCSLCFESHYSENDNRLDKLNPNYCNYVRLKKELYDKISSL